MSNSEHWEIERERKVILAGFRDKYGVEIKLETLLHIHTIE